MKPHLFSESPREIYFPREHPFMFLKIFRSLFWFSLPREILYSFECSLTSFISILLTTITILLSFLMLTTGKLWWPRITTIDFLLLILRICIYSYEFLPWRFYLMVNNGLLIQLNESADYIYIYWIYIHIFSL